ncbi:MAG: hypothetical protein ACKOKF_07680 [Bacteroidota bacterium]
MNHSILNLKIESIRLLTALMCLSMIAVVNETTAQSVTACTTSTVVNRFGLDGDLYNSTPVSNSDDWFFNASAVDSGLAIIGESATTSPRGISAAAFKSLLQSGVGGMNYSYEQRMAFPYQSVILV